MRQCLRSAILIALCGGALAACAPDAHDPRALPHTLELVRDLGKNAQTADLDGDGFDEVARGNYVPSGRPHGLRAVVLQTRDGRTIGQANFEGEMLPLHFLDFDGDGALEILVPYVRSDSLFLGIVDAQGLKRGGFLLAEGAPREEPDGTLPWDPAVRRFYLVDTDADGAAELVTVVATRFARHPRGVLVHRLPDGRKVGSALIGAMPTHSFLAGAGQAEAGERRGARLVVSTASPNNGASAGGYDDAHSYVIAFSFGPVPEVVWSRETGGLWSGTFADLADFDGDGRREVLVSTTTASSKPEAARFGLVELAAGQTVRHRDVDEPLRWSQTVDLDRDGRPEIVALRVPDEVWAFDGRFELVHRRRVARDLDELEVWPDADGDGVGEIAVHSRSEGWLLLDPELGVKARVGTGRGYARVVGVMRRGIGARPYLTLEQGDTVVAMELAENGWWWLYRYGPPALWVFGAVVALGAVAVGRSQHRRTRLLERVYPATVDAAANGLLVLDAEGRVVLMNRTLCEGLGLGAARTVEGERADEALSEAPAFAAFLRRAREADPPRHHADEIALGADGQPHVHFATADPVSLGNGSAPYWLVTLAEGRRDAVYLDARLWEAMAKKVTHDLKGPLSTIRLKAQEMQVVYRRQAPAIAEALDPYAEAIAERAEALQREIVRLMNILDVETLTLTRSDLSAVVRDAREAITRDTPPHATLDFRLEASLPIVLVDREQVQTALRNLVTNALRAVSGGGGVIVSTHSVSDLRLALTAYAPTDYVVLEVQDNGTGIAEADLGRVFEPGFTTAETGSGVGLVFVQRVAAHHGGFVEMESEEGVGSTFSLYLPVADP